MKLVEGTVASVPPQGGRKHPQQEFLQVDTSKILFICGGAFAGLDKVVAQRLNTHSGIGFGAEVKSQLIFIALARLILNFPLIFERKRDNVRQKTLPNYDALFT